MISVIVPAYNAAATIGECLDALLNQSVPRTQYEVIVVDDGSRDNTRDIVEQYPVTLLSQSHRGPAVARNRGVCQANGEIILFTDADCVPTANWIEEMLKPFENPEIVGVKGVYRTRQKGLIPRFIQLEYEDKYEKMHKERFVDFIDTYSAGYRKAVFEDHGGFDPIFPMAAGEDIEFSHRLAERGCKMVFASQAIVYHQHADSLSKYLRRKFYVGFWRVVRYQRYPHKILRDSHTPQSLKIQVGLAGLLTATTLGSLFCPQLTHLLILLSLTFALISSSFIVKVLRRDRKVVSVALALLLVRAFALGLGLAAGIVHRLFVRCSATVISERESSLVA